MENDLLLVVGLIFVALVFPTTVSAFSYGHSATVPVMCAVIGFGLILYVNMTTPGGYPVEEMPQVVVRVVKGIFT